MTVDSNSSVNPLHPVSRHTQDQSTQQISSPILPYIRGGSLDTSMPERQAARSAIAFRLISAMTGSSGAQAGRAALASFLSLLRVGDAARAIIRIGARSARSARLAFEISVLASDACNSATYRQEAKRALRLCAPSYRFQSCRPMQGYSTPFCEWSISLRDPINASFPMGFGRAADESPALESKIILLGQAAGQSVAEKKGKHAPTFDFLLTSLMGLGASIDIETTWAALKLAPQRWGSGQVAWADSNRHELDMWSIDPRGYDLRIRIRAKRSMPEQLLCLLGASILGLDPSMVKPVMLANGESSQPHILAHRTATPPQVFPSPNAFIGAGALRNYAPAAAIMPKDGIRIGVADTESGLTPIFFPDNERSRHAYIVGATGTGKSTLMLQMLTEDIKRGVGVMLIDPHGDLFEAVRQAIPKERKKDLMVLDAADFDRPFAFNILAPGPLAPRNAATFIGNELLTIFDALYDMKVCGGPVFETYFAHALHLLLTCAEATPTLSDLARVFEEPAFLEALLKRCSDPNLVRFWRSTAMRATGDYSLTNMTSYIVSKVNRLTLDSYLQPILTHAGEAPDLRRAMDEGGIVLAHLAKGAIGRQSARFLGMAIMMRLTAATLSRASVPVSERRPFNVYVDEFESIATESAGALLAEARKFGVGLTLASQTLSQLDQQERHLADLVTGNVGSLFMTRLGPTDAARLSSFTQGAFPPTDLQSLPQFHAVACFFARKIPPTPFVFKVGQRPIGQHRQPARRV